MQSLKRRLGCKGQGIIEYILVVFLMGILGIAAVRQLSNTTRNSYNTVSGRLANEIK